LWKSLQEFETERSRSVFLKCRKDGLFDCPQALAELADALDSKPKLLKTEHQQEN